MNSGPAPLSFRLPVAPPIGVRTPLPKLPTTLDVLRAACEKIADPKRWIKGAMGAKPSLMTGGGKFAPAAVACDSTDAKVCAWCMLGAIRSAARDLFGVAYHRELSFQRAIQGLARAISNGNSGVLVLTDPGRLVHEANDRDSVTHACVLAWFDQAITVEEHAG